MVLVMIRLLLDTGMLKGLLLMVPAVGAGAYVNVAAGETVDNVAGGGAAAGEWTADGICLTYPRNYGSRIWIPFLPPPHTHTHFVILM